MLHFDLSLKLKRKKKGERKKGKEKESKERRKTKAIDLYNNNSAPSFLRSLCEIGGDCFGPRYFSEGMQLPKKKTKVQSSHRRIHKMTETKMV